MTTERERKKKTKESCNTQTMKKEDHVCVPCAWGGEGEPAVRTSGWRGQQQQGQHKPAAFSTPPPTADVGGASGRGGRRGKEKNHALVQCTRILQYKRPNDPQSKSPISDRLVFIRNISVTCSTLYMTEVKEVALYNKQSMMVNVIFNITFTKSTKRCGVIVKLALCFGQVLLAAYLYLAITNTATGNECEGQVSYPPHPSSKGEKSCACYSLIHTHPWLCVQPGVYVWGVLLHMNEKNIMHNRKQINALFELFSQ